MENSESKNNDNTQKQSERQPRSETLSFWEYFSIKLEDLLKHGYF